MSTTTTIIDGKNGSIPSSSMKVGKKSVTEDLVTTFSSPAAWLLVVALIVTWSAVAIVMFDLVDYKTFAGRSVNKLSTEPLRIIHEALEESTDWLYGFISFLSDIVWSDDDDSDEGICNVKTSVTALTAVLHALLIHRDKPEKQEKIERKEPQKGMYSAFDVHLFFFNKYEHISFLVTHKDKLERQEKSEKRERHAEEKKVKSAKVEAKVKKEVKDGKGEAKMTEKIKQTETKTTEVGLIKAKPKVKEEKALQTVTKSEKKDQYAFCRYVIDMFAQGDFYPEEKSIVVSREAKKRKEEKKKADVKRATTETKKKDKKEAAVSKELKKPAKAPAAKQANKKTAAPASVETPKSKAVPEKREEKATKATEQVMASDCHFIGLDASFTDPGKEKVLKSPAATKDKEPVKEKEGKNPTALKDKDSLKGKNPKNPEESKEKETGKRKDVKPPAALKEKDSSKGKEMKASTMTKEKATSEKSHKHKHESIKHEKAISQTKTEHEAVRHEKDVPPTKPGVPPIKEAPRHHNLTTAPVRYFQCVFLNGPNGFGLQFPTNHPSNKEEKIHSKTSKRKTRKPGQ
ncbi:hypothetical protein llap_6250 [Limosa lapponica baueri]|uniref:Triadin n=1 Tax=Limosa lapponica baueri TaxID=1758121 RepID=A0A2I0UBQ1_LIMLA|nr:hypothetical protein llap_6250 [Limosa lapponica baueri]